jgi:U3 small nucleolar RNA-associated protein 18
MQADIDSDAPVWEDSGDERVTVSLASDSRLRKLRLREGEDEVNGREYTKRLRRQFELLHPPPQWAVQAKLAAKTRDLELSRTEDSENEMEIDEEEEELSALPLAKILRSNASLTVQRSANGKGRLKPEVIDIQRLKDIGDAQPVSIAHISNLLILSPL